MDAESLIARYLPFFKKYWLPLALFLVGMIFFIYGLISFFGLASKQQDEVTFQKDNSASISVKNDQAGQQSIIVDVEGAVVTPGVYKLTQNAIIQDALVSSGGLSSNADREYVSKNINLAARLYDGAKIYIPKIGEAATQTTNSTSQESGGASASVQALININTASSDALDTLPGVGPATAGKIISNRPYTKPDDLLSKKVVSSKVFDQIKDRITVY
jgi:competence protein ComEA